MKSAPPALVLMAFPYICIAECHMLSTRRAWQNRSEHLERAFPRKHAALQHFPDGHAMPFHCVRHLRRSFGPDMSPNKKRNEFLDLVTNSKLLRGVEK